VIGTRGRAENRAEQLFGWPTWVAAIVLGLCPKWIVAP
jgi:hypothetical protein